MFDQDDLKIDGEGMRKIGEPVLRKEDIRFVKGHGQYTDDLNKKGQLYGYFVRSQIAHGVIKKIKIESALAIPGVISVLNGKDFLEDGFGPIIHRAIEGSPEDWTKPSFDERDPVAIQFPQWPMPFDKVRHVGEPIAFIVADSILAAESAGELVEVELEQLSPITNVQQALNPNAPDISDYAPGNLVVHHY